MSLLSRVLEATISPEAKSSKAARSDAFADKLFENVLKPLPETIFRRQLTQERKRSERSRKSFLLMLVRSKAPKPAENLPALDRVARVLGGVIRETDTFGWFKANAAVGVIYSELGSAEISAAIESIQSKTVSALERMMSSNQIESHHFVKSGPAAAVYLPEAGDAGLRLQETAAVPNVVSLNFVANGRARTDQRHLAYEDVPELGDLIETGAAHEFADPGNARVVGNLVDAPRTAIEGVRLGSASNEIGYVLSMNFRICRNVHGAEF